ncbi:hypothetical protein EMEDMD4_210013 [Sinorhizobium medicae]|uniref:Uncharacterized protein n=1 Tax=Sinorhizobium medicae TaxID=110321 RepID=A0A508WTS2_9HYPH|nr:hypothetical protein EMEDMD4_210013 [Sinorhizobium medicae]
MRRNIHAPLQAELLQSVQRIGGRDHTSSEIPSRNQSKIFAKQPDFCREAFIYGCYIPDCLTKTNFECFKVPG